MKGSYRTRFSTPQEARTYEEQILGFRSYGALLWKIEREQLQRVTDGLVIPLSKANYLDFACGTGRVLRFMETSVARARGIDVSRSMLSLARERGVQAELLRADITAAGFAVEDRYDLITAFRFVLNAEPALRLAGLRALAARLRDPRSRLVFNVHAHLPSHKLVGWAYHRLHRTGAQPLEQSNYMTTGQVRQLAEAAGLRIESVFGYDMLSGKALRLLPYEALFAVERRLSGTSVGERLGAHQLYVAMRAHGSDARALAGSACGYSGRPSAFARPAPNGPRSPSGDGPLGHERTERSTEEGDFRVE